MAQKPKYSVTAQRLVNAGKYREAAEFLNDAANKHPNNMALYVGAAQVLTRHLERPDVSLQVIGRALKVNPKAPNVLQEAVHAHLELGNNAQAADFADRLMAVVKSPDAEQLGLCAKAYQEELRFTESYEFLKKAIKKNPKHEQVRLLYMESLSAVGKFKESEEIALEFLAMDEPPFRAVSVYVESKKIQEDDPIIDRIENDLLPKARAGGDPVEIDSYLRRLAKCKVDTGKHVEGFLHFKEGREINPVDHDPDQFRNFVKEVKSGLFAPDFFGNTGSSEERPVFVVGMPRVGSTLLERVLGSHPLTAGVGESGAWNGALSKIARLPRYDGKVLVDFVKKNDRAIIDRMHDHYISAVTLEHPNAKRIIDKSLFNFMAAGVLARAFPKARIIHALRDPMDNCVAIYLRNLKPTNHRYTQDLSSIGQFYREHRELMDHYKKTLPISIMEVRYEDMVADTEGMARKVIDFLGLDWDPACLEFQKSTQQVRTLSQWQVRQPVYKSSVKRWKHYEEFLDPLKKELEIFYPNGFDEDAI